MSIRRVGCLLVPRFPLACELAERPELLGSPAAVAQPDTPKVWCASPLAEEAGVAPGQPLREALARCPGMAVVEGRPARYDERAEHLLVSLEQAVAGVEPGPQGMAYIDLAAAARSQADRQALQEALLAVSPLDLGPRLGVGPTKFVALVAAHEARPNSVQAVGESQAPAFLAERSVRILPVSAEMRRRLLLLGIDTLGALGELPRSGLVAQFGPEGGRGWDLARGAHEPVVPRPVQERLVEHLRFEEPLASREMVLVAAEQALNAALRQPERRDRAARQLALRIEIDGGGRWECVVTCKEARVDRHRLWLALRGVLDTAPLHGPVQALLLELRGLTSQRGWQIELLPARSARRERLEETLRQLKAQYGRCPVGRVVQVEPWSRIPERRQALIDFDP
ncbi:MAG TPA: hypothetical protein VML96_09415 [Egibacteraceae bacterium]|nr:hypothetical protein [Egibacteraceae bacterium]